MAGPLRNESFEKIHPAQSEDGNAQYKIGSGDYSLRSLRKYRCSQKSSVILRSRGSKSRPERSRRGKARGRCVLTKDSTEPESKDLCGLTTEAHRTANGLRRRTAGWLLQEQVKAVFDYHLAKGPRSFDSAQPSARANVSSPFASLRMTDLEREAFAEVSALPAQSPEMNALPTTLLFIIPIAF